MSHWHGTARGKGGLLSRERRPPFDPPRERQGRFDLAPAPLTTKREGPCPSFLDYPPMALPVSIAPTSDDSVSMVPAEAALLRSPPLTIILSAGVRPVYIRQSEQIIGTNVIKSRKTDDRGAWNVERSAFISRICCLADIEHRGNILLCFVVVFSQIPKSLIHHFHLVAIIGYAITAY